MRVIGRLIARAAHFLFVRPVARAVRNVRIRLLEWEMERDRIYFRACRTGGVMNEPELAALRRAMGIRHIKIILLETS